MVRVVFLCRNMLCNLICINTCFICRIIKCINFFLCKSRGRKRKVISEKGEVIEEVIQLSNPMMGEDWSAVKIFSPVNGTVSGIDEEWAGTQVQINSEEYPAIFFILFHVRYCGGHEYTRWMEADILL